MSLLNGAGTRAVVVTGHEWGEQLVVLGTRGRTGLSRFMIGSVAEKVSRKSQATCDASAGYCRRNLKVLDTRCSSGTGSPNRPAVWLAS